MGITGDTPENLARWAIAEHRSEVLDMARAIASRWDWSGLFSDDTQCRRIAANAAAIVAAVDDELDGDA